MEKYKTLSTHKKIDLKLFVELQTFEFHKQILWKVI